MEVLSNELLERVHARRPLVCSEGWCFFLQQAWVSEVALGGITHIYQMLKEDSWSVFPGIRGKRELSNCSHKVAQARFEITLNIIVNRELCSL